MFTLELGKDIIAARVPFRPGILPSLEIKFRSDFEYPERDEYTFEERDRLWFGVHHTGLVKFYAHSGNDVDEGGFCGAHFDLNMKDGSKKLLKGPWSSNSTAMNMAGFEKSEHVSFKGAKCNYSLSGHITRELWEACIKHFMIDVWVHETPDGNERFLSMSQDYDARRYAQAIRFFDPIA